MLGSSGEDPQRDGLLRTPERVDKALRFLTSGYRMDIQKILNGALYEVKYDEMVVVKDIEFFSMCEHHMLPFFGKMHVAYLPQKKVIGLSKIPRIVDMFARRLQIQERLTQEMAQTIQEVVEPRGRRRDLRGAALLHDDAGRGEAALGRDDERDAGGVPDTARERITSRRIASALVEPPARGTAVRYSLNQTGDSSAQQIQRQLAGEDPDTLAVSQKLTVHARGFRSRRRARRRRVPVGTLSVPGSGPASPVTESA